MIQKLLPRSEFSKNVVTLFTGSSIAQAIPLLFSPILSRLYTPEEFGSYMIFFTIMTVLGLIATGRYEFAIILPKTDREANNVLFLSFIILTAFSIFSALLTLIFGNLYKDYFVEHGVWDLLIYLPFAIFFMAAFRSFTYWTTRRKEYKRNAGAKVMSSAFKEAGRNGMGYYGMGISGLVVGELLGHAVGAIALSRNFFKNLSSLKQDFDWEEIKRNAKLYKNFPQYNAPHALVDSIKNYGIVFFVSYYFLEAIVGAYSYALRVIGAPIGLVATSIHQVFYEKASKMHNEGINLRGAVLSVYKRLFLLGVVPFGILFFFGTEIFSFVFGANWSVAGEIAEIIAPWLYVNFIASSVSCIPLIVNKQKQAVLIAVIDTILRISMLVLGGIKGDYMLGFSLMSFTSGALAVFTLTWIYLIANQQKNEGTAA